LLAAKALIKYGFEGYLTKFCVELLA